ncbi:MAG: methyltransferase [Methanomassiliicoccales archaeon]|nr:methyltransferase [Methanomassiliicoccales archaeon]
MLRDPAIMLEVLPEVYAPAEDTFLMLSALEVHEGDAVLEMGCGSGFLSLHMAKAGAMVTAVDVDPYALRNSGENAALNGLRLKLVQSDLFQNVGGKFDLVVFNPPYLRGTADGQEDLCWAGGENGAELAGRFLTDVRSHLKNEGKVLVLISSDADPVQMELALQGWSWKVIASKRLFFEELRVLELTF